MSGLYGWGRGARPLVTWELISWFLDELPWASLNSNVRFPWKRKAGKKIAESLGSTGTPWNNLIRNPSICWGKNRQTTKRWNGPKVSSSGTKTQWRWQSVLLRVICRVSRDTEPRVYLQGEHLKFLNTGLRLKNRGAREVLWDWPNATTFTVIILTSPILHLRGHNWSRSLAEEVVFRLPSRCASPCVSFKCSRLVGKQKHSPMSTIDTHVSLSSCQPVANCLDRVPLAIPYPNVHHHGEKYRRTARDRPFPTSSRQPSTCRGTILALIQS